MDRGERGEVVTVILSEAKDLIAASTSAPFAIAMRSFAALRMTMELYSG
jgi:hypothetical protein